MMGVWNARLLDDSLHKALYGRGKALYQSTHHYKDFGLLVQSGKVGDVKDDPYRGRYRPAELPKYYCRRLPPRRSLGDDYHLTQVDPFGWCGESTLFFAVPTR